MKLDQLLTRRTTTVSTRRPVKKSALNDGWNHILYIHIISMACLTSCIIAFGLIVSMIYFYTMTGKNKVVQHYKEQLPSTLLQRYTNISNERQRISYTGYILGLILSFAIIFMYKKRLGTMSRVCVAIIITFFTNYFYYILSPKSDWMLLHLQAPEQTKAWLTMYREMQYNYHMGFVVGIAGAGLLAYGMC